MVPQGWCGFPAPAVGVLVTRAIRIGGGTSHPCRLDRGVPGSLVGDAFVDD
jgi:hypothetical protein